MDIQQIKYFSRVYEMRSFTQAADSLFISRQALRKSVARLAQEMGEPLFENRGNVLFPTAAADLLFGASRPVLSAFAQMEAELNLGKLKSQGIVRFGQSVEASDVMTSGEMRQVIDFSSTSELVTKGMRFTEANCVELRQQILEGDLDYASLIATVVNESLFDYDTAIGGRIHIAVRTDDPLAEKSFIRLEDLEGRPFTSQGAGFDVHDRLVEATEERGVKLDIVCTRSGLHNRRDAHLCLPRSEVSPCCSGRGVHSSWRGSHEMVLLHHCEEGARRPLSAAVFQRQRRFRPLEGLTAVRLHI